MYIFYFSMLWYLKAFWFQIKIKKQPKYIDIKVQIKLQLLHSSLDLCVFCHICLYSMYADDAAIYTVRWGDVCRSINSVFWSNIVIDYEGCHYKNKAYSKLRQIHFSLWQSVSAEQWDKDNWGIINGVFLFLHQSGIFVGCCVYNMRL